MGAVLYVTLVAVALSYWGLSMTVLMAFNIRAARSYMDRQSVHISRMLFRMATMYAGLRLELDDGLRLNLPDEFVVVSNHQSLADIPFLIAAFRGRRVRFVAKHSLSRFVPTVSPLLRYQRHALIRRDGNFSATYRAIRRLARATRKGIVPVVFPEGTRSRSGALGSFHEGAARVLLQIRPLPVVTFAIDGGHLFSRLRAVIFNMRGATYRGRMLSVRPAPRDKGEIAGLLTECRASIIEQLEQWRAPRHLYPAERERARDARLSTPDRDRLS